MGAVATPSNYLITAQWAVRNTSSELCGRKASHANALVLACACARSVRMCVCVLIEVGFGCENDKFIIHSLVLFFGRLPSKRHDWSLSDP